MRMIPAYIHRTASPAEKKIFHLIEDIEGHEDWYCLHSLGLADHMYKREGEIDFLLIGPAGVLVIEVKGGRIYREDGMWKFADRYGKVTEKRESPFSQAKSALYSLRAELLQKCGVAFQDHLFGYGVAFPDISFNIESPEWSGQIIFDNDDASLPFEQYIARLISYWSGRQKNVQNIENDTIKELVTYLRGDFETVRSLRSDLKDNEEEVLRLTEEQYFSLDAMAENPRLIFTGSAGTGKTLLALEKARRNEAKGIRTLLLCFNSLLAKHLQEIFSVDGESKYVEIKTVHSFLKSHIVKAGLSSELETLLRAGKLTQLYKETYPTVFMQAWQDTEQFDELIIDEAQDVLNDLYLDALNRAVSGGFEQGRWTMFLDPENQKNLFVQLSHARLEKLRSSAGVYTLTINCRNTRPIAVQTEVVSGVKLAKVKKIEGQPVTYLWHVSQQDHAAKVTIAVNDLLKQGARPEEIVILSPKKHTSSLAGSGRLRLVKPLYDLANDATGNEAGKIAYSTVQSFKGLERPFVVLTDIEALDGDWQQTVNYVGFSRARTLLIVALRKELEKEYLKRIEALLQQA